MISQLLTSKTETQNYNIMLIERNYHNSSSDKRIWSISISQNFIVHSDGIKNVNATNVLLRKYIESNINKIKHKIDHAIS